MKAQLRRISFGLYFLPCRVNSVSLAAVQRRVIAATYRANECRVIDSYELTGTLQLKQPRACVSDTRTDTRRMKDTEVHDSTRRTETEPNALAALDQLRSSPEIVQKLWTDRYNDVADFGTKSPINLLWQWSICLIQLLKLGQIRHTGIEQRRRSKQVGDSSRRGHSKLPGKNPQERPFKLTNTSLPLIGHGKERFQRVFDQLSSAASLFPKHAIEHFVANQSRHSIRAVEAIDNTR